MRARTYLLLPLLMQPIASGSAMGADYVIVVDKMTFGPLPAELHVGDTITWKNNDLFRHTATAEDQSFDLDLPVRSEVVMPLTAAGEWRFICKFHPGMTGKLVVLP